MPRKTHKQPHILTVAIQKGGTGKTTTAAILSQAAAKCFNYKVLAIDLDPQGNLTYCLGADPTQGNSYALLMGEPATEQIQTTSQGIHVIPASWDLSTVTSAKGSARRLEKAVKPLMEQYDLIVIDTPPTAGELQYNALQTATDVIIPLKADPYSVQSFYQIADTVKQIQQTNLDLKHIDAVLTQYDKRSTLARQMADTIKDIAESLDINFLGTVRNGIAVQEAAGLNESIYDYAPNSNPAMDYLEVFKKTKL